jgi:hypothetical protein
VKALAASAVSAVDFAVDYDPLPERQAVLK